MNKKLVTKSTQQVDNIINTDLTLKTESNKTTTNKSNSNNVIKKDVTTKKK